MRSVVVVLPASMWAMIPMLRVFSRLYLRGMEVALSVCLRAAASAGSAACLRSRGHQKKRALSGPDPAHGDTRGTGLCLGDLHGNGSAPCGTGTQDAPSPQSGYPC